MADQQIHPDTPFRTGVTGKYKLLIKSATRRHSGFEYELVDADEKKYTARSMHHYPEGGILRCIITFAVERAKLVVVETTVCGKQDFVKPIPSKAKKQTSTISPAIMNGGLGVFEKMALKPVHPHTKVSAPGRYRFLREAGLVLIKSYPYAWTAFKDVKCFIDNKKRTLILQGGKQNSFILPYDNGQQFDKTIKVNNRNSAYRVCMYFCSTIRDVEQAEIILKDAPKKKRMTVSVNRVPLLTAQYQTAEVEVHLMDISFFIEMPPITPAEIEAQHYGSTLVKDINNCDVPASIMSWALYPSMPHKETFEVQSVLPPSPAKGRGNWVYSKNASNSTYKPRIMYKGKSLPAPSTPSNNSIDHSGWVDRFDHDD